MPKRQRNASRCPEFPRLRKILHPTDFSYESDVAFAHAMRIALATSATLDVLHVDGQPRRTDFHEYPAIRETLVRWGELESGASRSEVTRTGIRVRKLTACDIDPGHGIVDFLGRHPHDLIVMSTHQSTAIARWFHKEIAARVLRESHTATLFVPEGMTGFVDVDDGQVALSRLLLPITDVPSPQPALTLAGDVVSALRVDKPTFSMLHVGSDHTDIPPLRYPNNDTWKWEWLVRASNVVPEIVTTARQKEPDLIVMTTLGHDGWIDAITGCTTERVVRDAPCPVLAVPGTDPAPVYKPRLAAGLPETVPDPATLRTAACAATQ